MQCQTCSMMLLCWGGMGQLWHCPNCSTGTMSWRGTGPRWSFWRCPEIHRPPSDYNTQMKDLGVLRGCVECDPLYWDNTVGLQFITNRDREGQRNGQKKWRSRLFRQVTELTAAREYEEAIEREKKRLEAEAAAARGLGPFGININTGHVRRCRWNKKKSDVGRVYKR